MFPSDLVFFPVIIESETLGFSGNPALVLELSINSQIDQKGNRNVPALDAGTVI